MARSRILSYNTYEKLDSILQLLLKVEENAIQRNWMILYRKDAGKGPALNTALDESGGL